MAQKKKLTLLSDFITWLGKRIINGLTTGLFLFLTVFGIVYALSYPDTTPLGETTGGRFMTYFTNMWRGCSSGQAIQWFSNLGVPSCVSAAAGGGNGSPMLLYSGQDEKGNTAELRTDIAKRFNDGKMIHLQCTTQNSDNLGPVLSNYDFLMVRTDFKQYASPNEDYVLYFTTSDHDFFTAGWSDNPDTFHMPTWARQTCNHWWKIYQY